MRRATRWNYRICMSFSQRTHGGAKKIGSTLVLWLTVFAIPVIRIRGGLPVNNCMTWSRRVLRHQKRSGSTSASGLGLETFMSVTVAAKEALAIHGGTPVRKTML